MSSSDIPSPREGLARELITLWINDEAGEVERLISRALLGDENILTVKWAVLDMVEALAHTLGNDAEPWRQQMLEVSEATDE